MVFFSPGKPLEYRHHFNSFDKAYIESHNIDILYIVHFVIKRNRDSIKIVNLITPETGVFVLGHGHFGHIVKDQDQSVGLHLTRFILNIFEEFV